MAMIKAGNISKNSYIIFKNSPHLITKTEFVSPGKGSAFIRCKLKSVITGNTVEFTFKSNETVEEADVQSREMQFLYNDGSAVVFMDPRTFEQVEVPVGLLEGKLGYFTPEMLCYILFYQENAIGVRIPNHVKLKVTDSPDAVAGNRVNAPKKQITVETGMTIQAPLFIRVGDVISIDTETGEYLSRSNE